MMVLRGQKNAAENSPEDAKRPRTNQCTSWFENRKRIGRAEVSRLTHRAVTGVTVQLGLQPALLLGQACSFESISSADFLDGHREMISDGAFGDGQAGGNVGHGDAAGGGREHFALA